MQDQHDALGLNLDLNGVDTASPVLEANSYVAEIAEVKVVENKAKTGNNLVVVFKTCSTATSVQGRAEGKSDDVKPGWTLRQFMPLQQSENPDAPDYRKQLAALQDAVEGTTKDSRSQFNPYTYVGRQVLLRVTVKDDETYGLTNEIRKVSAVPQ
jgi:hypothetical protein